MSNIRDTISKNLIKLRKQNKLTQAELAEKLNYSDKAVSRWESGEVTPDIETLNKIAEVYEINITVLFDENLKFEVIAKLSKKAELNRGAIVLTSICFVWLLATVVYVCLDIILKQSIWGVFVYAVPANCLVAFVFSCTWGTRLLKYIFLSGIIWSTLASLYISFLPYNIWIIFILGIPIQVTIFLWSRIKNKSYLETNKR